MSKLMNLVGNKYGSYTVLEKITKDNDNNTYWKCICECGQEKIVSSQHLRYGKAKQCRTCFESKHQLVGQKFGKLYVIKDGGYKKYGKNNIKVWYCKCDCGNKVNITTHHLIDGYSKSCGCTKKYKDETMAAFNSLFSSYRTSASSRNLEFKLTRDEFRELTKTDCHYCGTKPAQKFKRGKSTYIYNGIDRKDNSIGYIKNNVVSCCKQCNIAKHIMNYNEFINFIIKIYNNICLK